MSRQEDFIKAGIENHIHHCPQTFLRGGYAYVGEYEKLRSKIFEKGCEHGYQYAVDKAVEFLKEKEFGDWIEQEATSFIEDFRKSMEE